MTTDRPTDRRPATDHRRPTNDLTFGKFQMAICPRGVVRSTSGLILRWGFRGLRIAVADAAMGGQSGRPPIDQNLGLAMAARLRHGGKFSLKSLTFGHFLFKNVQKAFSFRGPPPVLCPWTPLGAPPPDPRLRSLHALAMPPPPLANPGSATGLGLNPLQTQHHGSTP